MPSPYTTGPWLENIHGAASRVAPNETAFAHRQHPYNFLVLSSWDNPSDADRNVQRTRECWDAMHRFMVDGAYVNYLEEEADPRARSAYGANHDRLVALKNSTIQTTSSTSTTTSVRPRAGRGAATDAENRECVYAAMVMGLSVVAATMTSAHAAPNDAAQIRALEDRLAAAVNARNVDAIMQAYIPDESSLALVQT